MIRVSRRAIILRMGRLVSIRGLGISRNCQGLVQRISMGDTLSDKVIYSLRKSNSMSTFKKQRKSRADSSIERKYLS